MTDKLIERIKTPSKWGGTCTDGSYVREMEARILSDAKIIKAADAYITALERFEKNPSPRANDVLDLYALDAAYRKAVSWCDT